MIKGPDDTDSGGGGGGSRAPAIVYTQVGINNPDFELGNTGWDIDGGWLISSSGPRYQGSWAANIDTNRTGASETNTDLINTNKVDCPAGKVINARGRCYGAGRDGNVAAVGLVFYDSFDAVISKSIGNFSNWGSHKTWDLSTVRATAPEGTKSVAFMFRGSSSKNGNCAVDYAEWDLVEAGTVKLTSPTTGSIYEFGESVVLSVEVEGTNPYPTKVDYKDASDGDFTIATSSVSPFSGSTTTLTSGDHEIYAVVTFSDGSESETEHATITVGPEPPDPDFAEFAASNSYTYLVMDNIYGLASQIPATSKITGVEIRVGYTLKAMIRAKDKNVDDPAASNPSVLFDIIKEGKVEAVLLQKAGEQFTATGNPMFGQVEINKEDFSTDGPSGVSDGRFLTSWTAEFGDGVDVAETIIGANPSRYSPELSLFGLPPIAATDFLNRAIGLRFVPTLGNPIPDYADNGDAVIRFGIAYVRVSVYFDAGSSLYYFANSDKSEVISADLVHYTVEEGTLYNGDASGTLMLAPQLTREDGAADDPLSIGYDEDWTIHAAYPPTDDNQIGWTSGQMEYNFLAPQNLIINNFSRYEFITSNFYGDEGLASIYGVNGTERAFAFDGTYFYRIQDYPFNSYEDNVEEKDKPRHIANHHGHLALGFGEGRVDLSVIGTPYNFDGVQGASSWAIGDNITGLLPLSGTILGIFAGNSIWGLAGTTVDNFTTQIISPKMGAIEYTITDMGFPVYANTYGIYTLAQTQQYGDYLGTPMSQDISPWLRPRLIRENNYNSITGISDKQIVCAWPVRSKNQYRIGFADGAILSMTINGGIQQAPTFSFQNYMVYTDDELNITTGVSNDPGQTLDNGEGGGGGGGTTTEWIDVLPLVAADELEFGPAWLTLPSGTNVSNPATITSTLNPRILLASGYIDFLVKAAYGDSAVISNIRGTAEITTADSSTQNVAFVMNDSTNKPIVAPGTTSFTNEQPWDDSGNWSVYLGYWSGGNKTYSSITLNVLTLEVEVTHNV